MSRAMSARRLTALIRKETQQSRGRAAAALRLRPFAGRDLRVRIALVIEGGAAASVDAVAGLAGSDDFEPIWGQFMPEAKALIRAGKADAILRVPRDFPANAVNGAGELQLILNRTDNNTATRRRRSRPMPPARCRWA